MKEEDIFDEIAYDVARLMAKLVQKHPRHEVMLVNALVDSLGAMISIAAIDPASALEGIAARLKATDHVMIRLRHFGHKLGVVQDLEKPTGNVLVGLNTQKPE